MKWREKSCSGRFKKDSIEKLGKSEYFLTEECKYSILIRSWFKYLTLIDMSIEKKQIPPMTRIVREWLERVTDTWISVAQLLDTEVDRVPQDPIEAVVKQTYQNSGSQYLTRVPDGFVVGIQIIEYEYREREATLASIKWGISHMRKGTEKKLPLSLLMDQVLLPVLRMKNSWNIESISQYSSSIMYFILELTEFIDSAEAVSTLQDMVNNPSAYNNPSNWNVNNDQYLAMLREILRSYAILNLKPLLESEEEEMIVYMRNNSRELIPFIKYWILWFPDIYKELISRLEAIESINLYPENKQYYMQLRSLFWITKVEVK